MKRFLACILALTMVLSLAACWRYRAPGFGILAAAILCAALCQKKA